MRALARAKEQLERVRAASRDPKDPEEAVMWAFYAYENCIAAVAEAVNLPLKKDHKVKANLARELFKRELVSRDIGDDLEELNELRKDVQYGEPSDELQEKDLEELATELENFIVEAESMIRNRARGR